MRFGLLVLCALLNTAWCDYKCICSYVVERDVYSMPSNDSDSIGYLYEFDCKPFITEDADWFTVAYEHKLGYVKKGDKIVIQTCPGQYPDADKITNSTVSPSSNSYTVEAIVPSADATEPPAELASTHAPTTIQVHTITTTQSALQACAALTHQSSTAFANNNFCYELVTLHQTFSDAERECMRKGGHLAHIQSMEEQAFLTSNLQHFVGDSYIWIGLQDTGREEHFEWTSGEPLSFTYWYPYRKDLFLHNFEDCVAMRTHNFVKVFDGEWEDLPCSRAHSYICQFDIQSGLNVFG